MSCAGAHTAAPTQCSQASPMIPWERRAQDNNTVHSVSLHRKPEAQHCEADGAGHKAKQAPYTLHMR